MNCGLPDCHSPHTSAFNFPETGTNGWGGNCLTNSDNINSPVLTCHWASARCCSESSLTCAVASRSPTTRFLSLSVTLACISAEMLRPFAVRRPFTLLSTRWIPRSGSSKLKVISCKRTSPFKTTSRKPGLSSFPEPVVSPTPRPDNTYRPSGVRSSDRSAPMIRKLYKGLPGIRAFNGLISSAARLMAISDFWPSGIRVTPRRLIRGPKAFH